MSRRTKLVAALSLLLVSVLGAWVISLYVQTKQAITDAVDILFEALLENPYLTGEQADSILIEYVAAGALDVKLIDDSIPADVFGNPLRVEMVFDSSCVMVHVLSSGIDGFPGTFDDLSSARMSAVVRSVRFRSDFDGTDSTGTDE